VMEHAERGTCCAVADYTHFMMYSLSVNDTFALLSLAVTLTQ